MSSKRRSRIVLPLGSIRRVDAERIFGSFVLALETEDESVFEFGIHSEWPRRRAGKALTAFADHLRQQPPRAAGLAE